MKRFLLIAAGLFAVVSFAGAKEDSYDRMARELSDISISTAPKIAIIPFSYVDKRPSEAGVVISERLTTRIVKLKTSKVIERHLLEGVMQELHLETTGIVDAETTRKLGRVLGVDVIITGTLMDVGTDKVEVNARTINTETAELLITSSAEIKKTWSDTPAPQTLTVAAPGAQEGTSYPAQPAVQQAPAPVAQKPRNKPQWQQHGFVDIFMGSASGSMDITFSNPGRVTGPDYGLNLGGATYSKLQFKDAESAQSFMPVGLRVAGFGKYWGGAFEISYLSQHLKKQETKAYYNGGTTGSPFEFYVDDYLSVNVLTLLSGDVMLRFTDKRIQPYVGMGIGMTVNSISSPYIYGFDDGSTYTKGFSELCVGFLFRIPMGVRVVLSPTMSLFGEYRVALNTFSFTRSGVKNETDTMTMDMGMVLFGAGFRF